MRGSQEAILITPISIVQPYHFVSFRSGFWFESLLPFVLAVVCFFLYMLFAKLLSLLLCHSAFFTAINKGGLLL